MISKIKKQIFSRELPTWFKFLNLCILLPTLIWPYIFYSTIFFLDNPSSLATAYFYILLVNAYPLYLVILAYFNSLLFQKNKAIGSVLPLGILLTIIYGVVYFVISTSQNLSGSTKREEERNKQGFIGVSDDFKIIHDKVYRYDTLVVGADAKTFEIVSWDWQRDKNFYYRFGKKVTSIDRQSFELLDYHYAKDNYHVYYDEKIIEGADAKTFHQIDGTQDGKDNSNCYRWGEKVDCQVLLTEE